MMRSATPITIVLADDDAEDCAMAREVLEGCSIANDLRIVSDGTELLDYLHRRGRYADPASAPRPGAILMDLNLPGKDCRAVVADIRADPALRSIPVVVLTASRVEEEVVRTFNLGAASFITKPITIAGLFDALRPVRKHRPEIIECPETIHRG